MDPETATRLLQEERTRVEGLIAQTQTDAESDRAAAGETGDIADPAERLTAEEVDDAVLGGLKARLDAISRAERRLRDGTYGRSVRSGALIPDERLEADPAAELTVEEETQAGPLSQ
jgi:RNA polymerase-binding transcription factor